MKSQIRDSQIKNLLEKASKRKYGKYLAKIVLKHLRGFKDEPVAFDFPVTAIIGPNGGGKTSVLGAAAIAYSAMAPRRFFAKVGKYDDSMKDWSIEYELIDRDQNPKDVIRRTASFKKSKWNRDALDRSVLLFGITRTVPASEQKEFLKLASSKFSVPDKQIESLRADAITAIDRILGKPGSNYKRLRISPEDDAVFLTGQTNQGDGYSEFHFGAGESSIIRMVSAIEAAPDESLILIEELENGLHPVATLRMTEYLIEVAERKKVQVIFTTHSDEALQVLPSQAIWAASRNRIFQGKLDISSLRALTGRTDPDSKLVIFVEDRFARLWVEAIIRQAEGVAIDHIEVHGMEGDGTAVSVNKHHAEDPSTTTPSICIIDGDSKQSEDAVNRVYRLPGQAPEREVFDTVVSNWAAVGGKVAVALLRRFEDEAKVRATCEEVGLLNHDAHVLFSQLGQKLGLIPEETVILAFTNMYAQLRSEELKPLLAQFADLLPPENANTTQPQTAPES